MSEDVLNPAYWSERLRRAPPEQLHTAVFKCPLERWRRIEARHREILARHIGQTDSVLDAGCGWGRLLELMPGHWDPSEEGEGNYVGFDLSPEFIALARRRHPGRAFFVADMRHLLTAQSYDVAVLVSVRPMVRRNCGDEVWAQMERELRRVAKRLLYLEYDPESEGSVE